jgi:putative PEP-CTERM system histidine kinase
VDSRSLTLITWSYGAAAVAYAIYALRIRLINTGRNAGNRPPRFIVSAALLSTAWGCLGLLFSLTQWQVAMAGGLLIDALRYGAWSGFVIALMRSGTGRESNAGMRAFARLSMILVVAGVLLNVGLALGMPWAQMATLQLLAAIVLTLILLEQLFRNASSDTLWSVKPLCLGLAAAFVFDLFLFADTVLFRKFDIDGYGIRGFVHAAVVPLLMVSTTRAQGWETKLRLSQKAAFHSATITIVGGYLLFMATVGYYVRSFGGEWGRALQFALVFAALLGLGVLVLSGSLRAKLRVFVGKHFFSYRYDYREEWLRFTQTLSAQDSPAAMGEQVIRGLADLVESPSGVLWLRDPALPTFAQSSRWNMPAATATEDAESPLCRFMTDSGWVVNLEEFRSYPRRYESLRLPEWLAALPNAWLIVPLVTGGEMIGFVVLGSARTSMDVNWEVNDLLRTAGRQAASFLAQMKATEALLEVRKFDAFNRMSAFVVHDLKNIVTQLSLMLKNAERHSEKPEFRQDMLSTVGHSVERMRQLMLQLREGATPPGTPIGVDLAGIIERIRHAKAAHGRQVDVQIEERLMTRGHEERIERVIGHLVQNAIEATDNGGRVWVRLGKQGGQAKVEVGDDGHGMSPDFIRERLFKPFQTTKQSGMGIGAYESFQYVQELGGRVMVDSEVNAGTRITMLLPLFVVSAQSDLRPKEAA